MKPFRPWRILGALVALNGSLAWSAEPPDDPPAVGTPAFPATHPPADLAGTPRSDATSSEDGTGLDGEFRVVQAPPRRLPPGPGSPRPPPGRPHTTPPGPIPCPVAGGDGGGAEAAVDDGREAGRRG